MASIFDVSFNELIDSHAQYASAAMCGHNVEDLDSAYRVIEVTSEWVIVQHCLAMIGHDVTFNAEYDIFYRISAEDYTMLSMSNARLNYQYTGTVTQHKDAWNYRLQ